MPEALLLLLALLGIGLLALWVHYRAYQRGYDAGSEEVQRLNRWADDILKDEIVRNEVLKGDPRRG